MFFEVSAYANMVLVSNVLKSVRRLVRTNDAFLLISQDYKLAAEYDKSYPVIQLPNRIVVLITVRHTIDPSPGMQPRSPVPETT